MFQDDLWQNLLSGGIHLFGTELRRSLTGLANIANLSVEQLDPYSTFLNQVTLCLQIAKGTASASVFASETQRHSSVGKSPASQRRFSLGRSQAPEAPRDPTGRSTANFFCAYVLIEQSLLRDTQENIIWRDFKSHMLPFFVKLLNALSMSNYYSSINIWLHSFIDTESIAEQKRTFSFARNRADSASALSATSPRLPGSFISWREHAKQFLGSESVRNYGSDVLKSNPLPPDTYKVDVEPITIKQKFSDLIRVGLVGQDEEYFSNLYQKVLSLLEAFSFTLFTAGAGKQKGSSHIVFYLELTKFYWLLHKEVTGDMGVPAIKQAYAQKIFDQRIIITELGYDVNPALVSAAAAAPAVAVSVSSTRATAPPIPTGPSIAKCGLCNDAAFFGRGSDYLQELYGGFFAPNNKGEILGSRSHRKYANDIYEASIQCGDCKRYCCKKCGDEHKVRTCSSCKKTICRYCYDTHNCSGKELVWNGHYNPLLFPI